MSWLARAAVFLAALLLFLAEPLAARELLPRFGGAAAVWVTSLVFFQAALLAGYFYAHLLARARGEAWRWFHAGVILGSVASAGLWVSGREPAGFGPAHPAASIFFVLMCRLGLPFVLLGATGPLLQVWVTRWQRRGVPWELYALSNIASLLALLLYPAVLEPSLSLHAQRLAWLAGLTLFAALSGVLAWRVPQPPPVEVDPEPNESPARHVRFLWFLLPLAAAMQLSAVTQHLTANIAAIPLLWIVPLAAYLLSFIVAFQTRLSIPRWPLVGLLAVLMVGLGQFLSRPEMALPIALGIGLFTLEIFVASLFCHAEVFRLRPSGAQEATSFYLMVAGGGAAGSFLVGMVAPVVFRANYDLSIVLALTAATALLAGWNQGPRQRLVWATVTVLLAIFCGQLHSAYGRDTVLSVRNFYGSLRVRQGVTPSGQDQRTLLHGTITHGTEIFAAQQLPWPTAYYAEDSGVGLALRFCCADRPRAVGVVGLGVGTLAAYGRAGDRFRFYELNPAVRPIAEGLFAYLRQSPATVTFASGDARTVLAAEPPQNFDVLVIDAFSGDAIPLHLLTVEALAVYRRHLRPGGLLLFHVSNQYVDLEPELAALAGSAGMQARSVESPENDNRGEFRAHWVLFCADPATLQRAEFAATSKPLRSRMDVWPWTDDHASLLRLLRW